MANSRIPPGGIWMIFGTFLLLTAGMTFFMMGQEKERWSRLHENGTKVAAVLSDKHVIQSELTGARGRTTTRTYHRLFFKPAEGVTAEQATLWAKTSAATQYGSWVETFDTWENRLWDDVEQAEFEQVEVGKPFELMMDGEDAMLFNPDGVSSRGFYVGALMLLLAVGFYVLGARARSAARSEELA